MKTRQQAIRHFIHFGKKENRTDKIQVKNEVKNEVKIEVKNKNILKYNLDLTRLPDCDCNYKINTFKLNTFKLDSLDLRNKLPPCYDQGQLGSCTANALVGAYEFLNPKFFGSRLFLYYNERKRQNSINYDSGSTVVAGIKSLHKTGLCKESLWVYNIKKFNIKPKPICYRIALKNKIIKYYNVIQTLDGMKSYINSGFPFVVGIAIYSSFESQTVADTGIVPMPSENDSYLGGHCVLVCGYTNTSWICRNSWGTNWGEQGYFYLPYDYLLNPNLCSDNWCIESDTT